MLPPPTSVSPAVSLIASFSTSFSDVSLDKEGCGHHGQDQMLGNVIHVSASLTRHKPRSDAGKQDLHICQLEHSLQATVVSFGFQMDAELNTSATVLSLTNARS
jgi:hypothetical protein